MKKIFLIFIILLFSQITLTADIYIDSISIMNQTSLLENSDINISIVIGSDFDTNFVLVHSLDGIVVDAETYSIDTNQLKTFYFLKNNVYVDEDYNYNYMAEIVVADSNVFNNKKEINFHVFKGINIAYIDLKLSKYNVKEGEVITVTARYENKGDLATGYFESCFVYDLNAFFCWEDNLGPRKKNWEESMFTIPSIDGYIKLHLDINSSINEYSESDNKISNQFSLTTIPDLIVKSIFVPNEIKTGEDFNINVEYRNIGGAIAENFIAEVYRSSISSGNLLRSDIITLEADEGVVWSIPYVTYSEGSDIIIALIDVDNSILENSESNNRKEKSFRIVGTEIIEGKSYTAEFQIRKDCQSLLSNGDRIIAKDFNANSVNLKIIDSEGRTLYEGEVENGFEKVIPGRTIRVIHISKTLARIIIVYQSPFAIVYNECTFDAESVAEINTSLKIDVIDLQKRLIEEETKYSICKSQIDTNSNEFGKCIQQRELAITDYTLCLKNKSSVDSDVLSLKADLSGKNNECTNRIVEEKKSADIREGNLKDEYEVEKFDNTVFSMIGYVLFFSLSGIWAFDYRKRKTGKGF